MELNFPDWISIEKINNNSQHGGNANNDDESVSTGGLHKQIKNIFKQIENQTGGARKSARKLSKSSKKTSKKKASKVSSKKTSRKSSKKSSKKSFMEDGLNKGLELYNKLADAVAAKLGIQSKSPMARKPVHVAIKNIKSQHPGEGYDKLLEIFNKNPSAYL